MKEAKTHITIILDRTGSMEGIRSDTIGGFNAFLKQQQQEPGDVTMTLVQFDAQDPYEVIHDCRPIREIPELNEKTYVPRAATPLFDAMGRGINHLQQTLYSMSEGNVPEKVVIVVITDGQENSSREFNKKQVTAMINEKQEKAGWKFVFLSADLSAMEDAMASGFAASSSLLFDKTAAGVGSVWGSISRSICDFRVGLTSDVQFTDEDRSEQELEKKRQNR
jgi:Mg-chelatase subunit ChlD